MLSRDRSVLHQIFQYLLDRGHHIGTFQSLQTLSKGERHLSPRVASDEHSARSANVVVLLKRIELFGAIQAADQRTQNFSSVAARVRVSRKILCRLQNDFLCSRPLQERSELISLLHRHGALIDK